ncbi:MAG: DUF1887 family CARF protein [Paludibacter sp.]|nr:DUF1887 family CARF protein [Paludibacter sp.]
MKTLLVSLLSDQTIPNVQLINELGQEVMHYLFISTKSMKLKGVVEWIKNACNIHDDKVSEIEVEQFLFDDIEAKLDNYNFDVYDRIVVNLTGGTKLMTLAAFDFFKELGAEIYYLTGKDDAYIKLSPGRKKITKQLISKINLRQYLLAYGFKFNKTNPSNISIEQTNKMFHSFVNGLFSKHIDVLERLRDFRNKSIENISNIVGLTDFLSEIEYTPLLSIKLNKYEIKYLTGEWFEEYVASKIKQELGLPDEDIEVGLVINKKNKNGILIPNEMDVLFVYKNVLYTIECKTSVYYRVLNKKAEYEQVNLLKETIFKSDSLKQGFGLFVNTFIFVLDELKANMNLERAELSGIQIIDKVKLTSGTPIKNLLKIQN